MAVGLRFSESSLDLAVAREGLRMQVRGERMDNITAISVMVCFVVAVAVFLTGMLVRRLRHHAGDGTLPPPISRGKVPVWFYRHLDLLGLVFIAGLFFLMAIGNTVESGSSEEVKISVTGLLFSIGFQLTLAGAAAGVVLSRVTIVQWLGLKWRSWPLVFAIAPATVISMWALFAGLYSIGYMDLMDRLGVEKVQDAVKVFQEESDPVILSLMAFAAAIVAPVCEEVVFRGYLYPVAKRFSGPWAAAFFSALVFGAAHGSLAALLPLCIFGLVLVALYEFTGSIWSSIAVHFLFNGATVAIQLAARAGLIDDPGV